MICASTTEILAENSTPPAPASTGKKPKRGGVPAFIKQSGPYRTTPDLSEEWERKMNAAKAGPVWAAILTRLNRKAYTGRATTREKAQAGLIEGLGNKTLARICECNPATVRDRLDWLEANGFIRRHSRNVTFATRDPQTGKLTTNTIGRHRAAAIQVTISREQLRPCRKKNRGSQYPYSDSNPEGFRVTQDTPTGSSSGRYRVTRDTSDPKRFVPLDGEQQPPSSGESGGGSRSSRYEEQREPRPFTGEAAERKRLTLERIASQSAEREATPMNPATVRAADAATPAAKPPDSIREGKLCGKPRSAAPLRLRTVSLQEQQSERERKQEMLQQIAAAELRHQADKERLKPSVTASRVSKPESEPERRSLIAQAFGWVSRAQAS